MTDGTVFYFSHDQQKLARHINPNNTANKKTTTKYATTSAI